MPERILCTSCGKHPWRHKVPSWWEDPPDRFLCCRCFVKEGGAPADWHSECMKVAEELERKEVTDGN